MKFAKFERRMLTCFRSSRLKDAIDDEWVLCTTRYRLIKFILGRRKRGVSWQGGFTDVVDCDWRLTSLFKSPDTPIIARMEHHGKLIG